MKKVNSIGKKLMAVGLSASLLMGSVGVNFCFANPNSEKIVTVSTETNEAKKDSKEFKVNGTVEKVAPNNKVSEKNKRSNFKENMKKALAVCKWLMVSGFLAYAGYKNSKDIFAFCKDFCNFLVENKETFKEILNGGFTALKGVGNAVKGVSNAVLQVAKFVAEHPEATKNTMAAVGTYHVGKGLYNKVKKWFSSDKSDSKKETTYKFTAKISQK